jgi:ParB family transcriptional regulator, chromosome partitioning protein
MEPKSKSTKSSLGSRFPSRDVFFGTSSDLPRIVELDVAKIVYNPDQPRKHIDPVRLQELADSITAHGLIHPITVRRTDSDQYMVIAGERRFRAFGLLERTTLPAIISEGSRDELALIENIQREELSPIDEYRAIARLMQAHCYSQGDAATALGKSRTSINEIMSLARLAPSILDEMQSASVSKSMLVEIARAGDEAKQVELWSAIQGGATTVRALRGEKTPALKTAHESTPLDVALRAGRRFANAIDALPDDQGTKFADISSLVEQLLTVLDEIRPVASRSSQIEVNGLPLSFEGGSVHSPTRGVEKLLAKIGVGVPTVSSICKIEQLITNKWRAKGPPQARLENILTELVHRGLLEQLIDELETTPDLLAEVARRSFDHPTGASKLILSSLGEEWPQLRVHFWHPIGDAIGNEMSIHDHRWDFASTLLAGELFQETFEPSDSGLELEMVKFIKIPGSEIYDTKVDRHAMLKPRKTKSLKIGELYSLPNHSLHRLTNRGTTLAATLFLRGPYVKNETHVYHQKSDTIVKGEYPSNMSTEVALLRVKQLASILEAENGEKA